MAKAFSPGQTGNRLLNRFGGNELERLQRMLKKVELQSGHVLYEPREAIDEVYFPTTAVLSAVTLMQDGHIIEVGTIGYEGVSGLPAFSIVADSPHRVFAQIAGEAWRVDAKALNKELDRSDAIRDTLMRYQQACMFLVSQCVACNGLHVMVERCCRWLLMTHDRTESD